MQAPEQDNAAPAGHLTAADQRALATLLASGEALAQVRPPSAAQIQTMEADAERTLAQLQDEATPKATVRALRSVLRYWTLWYAAAYNEALPLLATPAAAVPADRVLVFIAHHAPRLAAVPGARSKERTHLTTDMPDWVRANLAALQAALPGTQAGRRRMAARATEAGYTAEADVPALKTLEHRLTMLSTLHRLRGLAPPGESDGRIRPMIRTVAKAVRAAASPALPRAKKAVTLGGPDGGAAGDTAALTLRQLIEACDPARDPGLPEGVALPRMSWLDRRDRAMLLVAFFAGGRRRSELAGLRFEHLDHRPARLADGTATAAYWWRLYRIKGRVAESLDAPVLEVPIIGAAADALDDWLDVLRQGGITTGQVWRSVYMSRPKKGETSRETLGAPIPAEVLTGVLKDRARIALGRAGLADEDRIEAIVAKLGAHSLRSGFTTSQLEAGVDPLAVASMTGHRSLDSFRIYDQRENTSNPSLKLLAGSRL
jgi:integrase